MPPLEFRARSSKFMHLQQLLLLLLLALAAPASDTAARTAKEQKTALMDIYYVWGGPDRHTRNGWLDAAMECELVRGIPIPEPRWWTRSVDLNPSLKLKHLWTEPRWWTRSVDLNPSLKLKHLWTEPRWWTRSVDLNPPLKLKHKAAGKTAEADSYAWLERGLMHNCRVLTLSKLTPKLGALCNHPDIQGCIGNHRELHKVSDN
eukprot:1157724-Pelagomonas_calceolata.AAC.3